MRTFDVYKHSVHGYEAVKQGFSFPGFFFVFIWAFIKKLWSDGFALLGVLIVLMIMQSVFEEMGSGSGVTVALLLQLGLYLWCGLQGNEWRVKNLKKRAFEFVKTVEAETPDDAIAAVTDSGTGSGFGPGPGSGSNPGSDANPGSGSSPGPGSDSSSGPGPGSNPGSGPGPSSNPSSG